MEMAALRSTTLAYYLFIYTVSLGMQVTFGGTSARIWTEALIAVPALIVGILIGLYVFKHIRKSVFFVITYMILIASGLYLMVSMFL